MSLVPICHNFWFWGDSLVRRLLRKDPNARCSAAEALQAFGPQNSQGITGAVHWAKWQCIERSVGYAGYVGYESWAWVDPHADVERHYCRIHTWKKRANSFSSSQMRFRSARHRANLNVPNASKKTKHIKMLRHVKWIKMHQDAFDMLGSAEISWNAGNLL